MKLSKIIPLAALAGAALAISASPASADPHHGRGWDRGRGHHRPPLVCKTRWYHGHPHRVCRRGW